MLARCQQRCKRGRPGQFNAETGTIRLPPPSNAAPQPFRDLARHGQAQADALLLAGDERLEEPVGNARRRSGAGILYFNDERRRRALTPGAAVSVWPAPPRMNNWIASRAPVTPLRSWWARPPLTCPSNRSRSVRRMVS